MQQGQWVSVAMVLMVAGVLLSGCDDTAQTATRGAMAGEALFSSHCAVCHRSGGAGKLDPASWHAGVGKMANKKVFRAYLRDTGNVMPSIPESVLSDSEVDVLYDYLTQAEATQPKAQP
jgi:mono/diheme cytochrome c family protein